jgi:outer membrane protein OmpA-like peptidoglycan-associated protein
LSKSNLFYGSGIQSDATTEDKAMTRRAGLPFMISIGLVIAFSMAVGLAFGAENDVTADQIVNALQAKPLTRSLSADRPVDPEAKAREQSFVEGLRNRKTRSLSLGEREQVAEIASNKPQIDLDIQFEYNSAKISQASLPAVQELGKALSDPALKGSTFMVAGHTDAVGGDAFNQSLSERRADTIKRYLADKYGLASADLVTVGYGKTRLKDPKEPTAAVNRRVQVVNLNTKTASK